MSKKKYVWCQLLKKELQFFGIECFFCTHLTHPIIDPDDHRVCIFAQEGKEE